MSAIEIGQIEAIFRHPVKSMRGEALDGAALGWHGLDGDRRVAVRRVGDRSDFPWLIASKLPELVRFAPQRSGERGDGIPSHVVTPDGRALPIFSDELAADIARRFAVPVEMMLLKHGIFDDGSVSVISSTTVDEIGRLAGMRLDLRRFRPNIVVRSTRAIPFEENDWVGGVLAFGDADTGPAVAVTARDVRCAVVNFDPDGGPNAPDVLKAIVRANDNHAGIYATATRTGRIVVGQTVTLRR